MSEQHTPASLADVLERDYFPMPDGKNLYLNEYEWRMVVAALRSHEADDEVSIPLGLAKDLANGADSIAVWELRGLLKRSTDKEER